MAVVSIVMPVYNGEKYLRQSIASVVNQTFMDWNLIFEWLHGKGYIQIDVLLCRGTRETCTGAD